MLGPQFLELLDLSSVPEASRRVVGVQAVAALVDIIGRLDLPPMESVPDADVFDEGGIPASWRIPDTPITIVRIKEGPREGEFLFSARTVSTAPEFYQRIQHLPLRSSLGIESWSRLIPQIHGPMIPARLVSALPDSLKHTWLDAPVWKIIVVITLAAVATLLLVLWHRTIDSRPLENKVAIGLRRVLTPAAIILLVLVLRFLIAFEVNVIGTFAQMVDFAMTLVIYLAAVWTFWLVVLTLSEWIILSPRIPDDSLDSDLLRLGASVIGLVGGVLILAHGAQNLGLPVLGLLAGLGVGGLAVGLAIRPTLENLIGGVILYMDRPVRVGDFCSFGNHMGTVESIGVRSTQIRALDRTVIFVPNATFADMEIVNWGKCDRMLILTTIGLRYETEPDQLRYVLVKLREMFHAHPRIDRDTVRVRFTGHGASSLDVQVRVYVLTRDWNDFYAIQEDVFLRPFPTLTSSRIESLGNTLDYPPYGSPHGASLAVQAPEAAELLSAEPEDDDTDNQKAVNRSRGSRRRALLVCPSTALAVGVAHGKECEGVSFSEQVQSEGGTLMLNGLGLRQATFLKINVYVAVLMLLFGKKESFSGVVFPSP